MRLADTRHYLLAQAWFALKWRSARSTTLHGSLPRSSTQTNEREHLTYLASARPCLKDDLSTQFRRDIDIDEDLARWRMHGRGSMLHGRDTFVPRKSSCEPSV